MEHSPNKPPFQFELIYQLAMAELNAKQNFFFSSRRRHTIWNCDWSSDVCSSDLDLGQFELLLQQFLKVDEGPDRRTYCSSNDAQFLGPFQKSTNGPLRYIQAGRDLKLSPSLFMVHPG